MQCGARATLSFLWIAFSASCLTRKIVLRSKICMWRINHQRWVVGKGVEHMRKMSHCSVHTAHCAHCTRSHGGTDWEQAMRECCKIYFGNSSMRAMSSVQSPVIQITLCCTQIAFVEFILQLSINLLNFVRALINFTAWWHALQTTLYTQMRLHALVVYTLMWLLAGIPSRAYRLKFNVRFQRNEISQCRKCRAHVMLRGSVVKRCRKCVRSPMHSPRKWSKRFDFVANWRRIKHKRVAPFTSNNSNELLRK